MSIAAVIASTCCCGENPCNCTAVTAVTVTWDGSITLEAECSDPECNDSGSYSMGAVTITNLSVVATQQRGSGNCFYTGTHTQEIELTNCDDMTTVSQTVEAYVIVSWNSFFSKWDAAFYLRVQSPCESVSASCSWYTGGFNNALLSVSSRSPTGSTTCPPLEAYDDVAVCGPSGLASSPFCSSGACPVVSSYTPGSLTVS